MSIMDNKTRQMHTSEKVTVKTIINAKPETVWTLWTEPSHIMKWNHASEDWHTPHAESDLKEGGRFRFRMESRDGKTGFDFTGMYNKVEPMKHISYVMDDQRKVDVFFNGDRESTELTEIFEAEQLNSIDLQRQGWQAILNNFRSYAELYGKRIRIRHEIQINAGVNHTYKTMIDDKQYRGWTSVFNPGSCFSGSWNKGSKILFIGTGEDGTTGGMVSRIKENIPGKFISIEHLGMLKDGKEILSGPEVESWAGAEENYSFSGDDNKTLLTVELDTGSDYVDYFNETWPKALKLLKEICERS